MIEWINEKIFGWMVPLLLLGGGIFYNIRLRFFYMLHPGKVFGVFTNGGVGERSPLRAMCLALAGTLGVGNLVGVSSAICLGGAGAVFWMWISALCAMLLKYAEIVLAMTHRRWGGGQWHGSAMQYIKDFFIWRKHPVFAKVLAALFALLCILNALTMGSMIQVHAISEAMEGVMGVSPWVVGTFLAFAVLFLLWGGTEWILSVSARLVPLMTAGYLILSLAAIARRLDAIPSVFCRIIEEAFTCRAAVGGVGGFLLGNGVRYGSMRGLLSNEAGCGTAPMAHATTDGRDPVAQGIWGIFEVFADTVLLCTLTALVILCSGVPTTGEDYMMVTVDAYVALLGNFSSYFLCVAVLLFGFATVICWAHYGMECVLYLSPSPKGMTVFRMIYPVSVLVGGLSASKMIWQIADFSLALMTVINLPVLCGMSGEVKRVTDSFLRKKSS